jgi:hypothetical protein
LQVVNPGERVLYPQLLCVFSVALTGRKQVAPPIMMKSVAAVIYLMLVCAVTNLVLVTSRDGYEAMNQKEFIDAAKDPMRILYWHRPYQFGGRYEYMAKVYESKATPDLEIIFPTGLIANKIKKPVE